MNSDYNKGKCDYCGEEKMVRLVQSGFGIIKENVQGLELENNIRDFINRGKRRDNPIVGTPFLCAECFHKILKILR